MGVRLALVLCGVNNKTEGMRTVFPLLVYDKIKSKKLDEGTRVCRETRILLELVPK
jgi:hypothetical protein